MHSLKLALCTILAAIVFMQGSEAKLAPGHCKWSGKAPSCFDCEKVSKSCSDGLFAEDTASNMKDAKYTEREIMKSGYRIDNRFGSKCKKST
ncbi:hypothetical protein BGX20_004214, partial [Mortierella sp. AD010]